MADIETQFLQIYEENADAIFRHCYIRVFDRELAKDLVQETFTRTWRYLAEGKSIDNMRAFLYKVATNLIINNSRRKKEVSLDDLQEDGFDPGFDDRDSLINFLEGKKVMEELDQLDEKYSSAIIMRLVEGLSPAEIALATGETENVISVRIHRGLKKLKQLLEQKDEI